MSSVCHLSGLPLRSGARVLILPVAYGMPAGSAYCNSANAAADLFHLPLIGQLQDFGMVRVENGDALLTYINNNLAYKHAWFAGHSPYHFGSELFACLKSGQDGQPLRGEWIDPQTVLEPSTPESRSAHILQQPFASCAALFETLLHGGLTQLGQTKMKTYTFVVVDYAFFQNITGRLVGDRLEQGVNGFVAKCMKTLALGQEKDHRQHWVAVSQLLSGDTLHNAFQIGMNTALDPLFKSTLETLLLDLFEKSPDADTASTSLREAFKTLSTAASVYHIYRALGRSFLPQVNSVQPQSLAMFAQLLVDEVESRRAACRAELLDDGYTETEDRELLDRMQWHYL